eukprot:Opistho-2@40146
MAHVRCVTLNLGKSTCGVRAVYLRSSLGVTGRTRALPSSPSCGLRLKSHRRSISYAPVNTQRRHPFAMQRTPISPWKYSTDRIIVSNLTMAHGAYARAVDGCRNGKTPHARGGVCVCVCVCVCVSVCVCECECVRMRVRVRVR